MPHKSPYETGVMCLISGLYICSMHPENYIPMNIGERFPVCDRIPEHRTHWELKMRAAEMLKDNERLGN